jgi:hypothetical protein
MPRLITPSINTAAIGKEYSLFATLKLKTPQRRPLSSHLARPKKSEEPKRCQTPQTIKKSGTKKVTEEKKSVKKSN